MLVKDTFPFVDNTAALPQSSDPHLELEGILITMSNRQQLHVLNIYIRHEAVVALVTSIAHLLFINEMSLIVWNINAHHSRWDTNTNEDERGEQLADEIDAMDYTILSENEDTRLPTNGRSTSPDVCLASNDIALVSDWSVSTSMTSDHFTTLITINSALSTIDEPRRTYVNFTKADWARYGETGDKFLAAAGEARTVEQADNRFRKAVNNASCLCNPNGRIQHFQPILSSSAKSLAHD